MFLSLVISVTLHSLVVVLFWKGPGNTLKGQIKMFSGDLSLLVQRTVRERDCSSHTCDLRWQFEDKAWWSWQDDLPLGLRKSSVLSNNDLGPCFCEA